MCFTWCVHVPWWCRSWATLTGTLTPRVICMFECVCVYVVNKITPPCDAKKSDARCLDSGLTVQIRVDARQSKPCLRRMPRGSFWSVCTNRSKLPIVLALERFASVWAIGRKSCRVICQLCPGVSAKRMRLAQSESPPYVSLTGVADKTKGCDVRGRWVCNKRTLY